MVSRWSPSVTPPINAESGPSTPFESVVVSATSLPRLHATVWPPFDHLFRHSVKTNHKTRKHCNFRTMKTLVWNKKACKVYKTTDIREAVESFVASEGVEGAVFGRCGALVHSYVAPQGEVARNVCVSRDSVDFRSFEIHARGLVLGSMGVFGLEDARDAVRYFSGREAPHDSGKLQEVCSELWEQWDLGSETTEPLEAPESPSLWSGDPIDSPPGHLNPIHTGVIGEVTRLVHGANISWWRDPVTGEPIERNRGEQLCLIHSEISEAMEGERKGLMDDKLPHRPMAEVELADAVIRIMDYCGGHGYDLAGAMAEKLAYNRERADHKPESRVAANGKKW